MYRFNPDIMMYYRAGYRKSDGYRTDTWARLGCLPFFNHAQHHVVCYPQKLYPAEDDLPVFSVEVPIWPSASNECVASANKQGDKS